MIEIDIIKSYKYNNSYKNIIFSIKTYFDKATSSMNDFINEI